MVGQILIWLAIGVASGLLLNDRLFRRSLSVENAVAGGGVGGFLGGSLFWLIADRSLSGWIDPLAAALAALGAVAFLTLLDRLSAGAASHRRDPPPRPN